MAECRIGCCSTPPTDTPAAPQATSGVQVDDCCNSASAPASDRAQKNSHGYCSGVSASCQVCCGQEDNDESQNEAKDDCCTKKNSGESSASKPACGDQTTTANDNCCNDSFSKIPDFGCQAGCYGGGESAVKPEDARRDDCCNDIPKTVEDSTSGQFRKDTCSAKQAAPMASDECNDSCCDPKPKVIETDSSICCGQKRRPCCDDTCLDRVARRECKKVCGDIRSVTSESTSAESSQSTKRPCDSHNRSVRDNYSGILKSLGCLCRTLIAQGQQSCCVTSSNSSLVEGAVPSRIAGQSTYTILSASNVSQDKKSSCRQGCCDDKISQSNITEKDSGNRDLERGLSGQTEHVVLSVSGMTCTGCETKLQRTFAQIPHLQNVKTSLVLSRAELDIDLGRGTVEDVIAQLIRATGFKVERITNGGAEIDIIPTCDISQFLDEDLPIGVFEMAAINKRTVRISFDPKIIGARDLIEKGTFRHHVELAPPQPDPNIAAGNKHVLHVGFMTLLSVVLTVPVLVMAWAPIPDRPIPYGSASLALATIIQVVIAGPFYPQALKSLIFSRMIEMDLLIVLSTSAAYIFSVVAFGYLVAGNPLSTGEFFETSTLLVTLIMVGRFLSALARQKAVESISIRSLQAPKALLVDEQGQNTRGIDARLLQFGDFFKVIPESRIPTDGTVISGTSEVDESMITGESVPVLKSMKSTVIAGSVNGTGTLTVRLTRLPGDNTITTIAAMVDEAKLSKPRIQAIADRVASYFVPVVVVLAIITFATWVGVGIGIRHDSGSDATINAITYAITVLIVSCPCAIGLAVPMVIVIVSGVAAEHGVIFKAAETVEIARKVTHVVFDKTGTLTEGKLAVAAEDVTSSQDRQQIMAILAGLVADVKHPVSVAVSTILKERGITPAPVSDVKTLPGKGVEGFFQGKRIQAGNSRWLHQEDHPKVQNFFSQGLTVFCFVHDNNLSAVFGLKDSLRPSAIPTISALHARGIKISIISGDDEGAVTAAATALTYISETHARCSPSDKQSYLRTLISQNPQAVTLFCGDGTNDAVALAQATIGVHMSEGGTEVAQSAADVVLARPDLGGVLTMLDLSRAAVRRIGFNFAWSFVYNLLAILLASGALVDVRIPPQYGGLGELVSVLPVVAIAVQLKWARVGK